jgi:transposase InsO family protein
VETVFERVAALDVHKAQVMACVRVPAGGRREQHLAEFATTVRGLVALRDWLEAQPGVRPAPDLVARDFNPTEPNRLWAADLTEVSTWEGTLYLAAIIDCYSRRCVGWAMAEHMRAELVVEALEMAVWQRKPDRGLIHHSDQGSQPRFKGSLQRRCVVEVNLILVSGCEPRSGEARPARP